MGSISARDCLHILELTEQVAASSLLAAHQTIDIRSKSGDINLCRINSNLANQHDNIMSEFQFVDEDRPLEEDIRKHIAHIRR